MDTKTIIAIIVALGVSLGLLYAIDTFVYKTTTDIIQNLIKIVTVLIVVGIAGWITTKIVHKEGVGVKVDGIKS